jgi:hypothetical protein
LKTGTLAGFSFVVVISITAVQPLRVAGWIKLQTQFPCWLVCWATFAKVAQIYPVLS